MSKNPFLDFIKSAGKPRDVLMVWDVDLAIQPSMSTATTDLQKQHMWELYERTDGGVVFFTGRTHQSVNKTFGHDYAGVFEHYSVARFGHGHDVVYMAPELDIAELGRQATARISAHNHVSVVADPTEINKRTDLAVYVEEKNTSIALVHTLKKGEEAEDHLKQLRAVLQPVAHSIIDALNLRDTHEVKTGGDAVEIVPKGMSEHSTAGLYLPKTEIARIGSEGLSKSTAVHNFKTLFADRHFIITGDSSPDLDAMVVNKQDYEGHGIYVSNGIPLKDKYKRSVDAEIPHHTMTWPLITDTVVAMRASAPIIKLPSLSSPTHGMH